MNKYKIVTGFILILNIFFIEAAKKEVCEKCVKLEDCPTIANLPDDKKQMLLKRILCDSPQNNESIFYVSTITHGDYICCPKSNGVEIEPNENQQTRKKRQIEQVHNKNETASNIGPYYPNQLKEFQSQAPTPAQNQVPNNLQVTDPAQQNIFPPIGNGNPDVANSETQCTAQTSSLPDPRTGCCGQDVSDSLRISDLQTIFSIFAPMDVNVPMFRRQRSADSKTDDNGLDDRIVGGKATELDQFPWTVLLKMTYTFGNQLAQFICGGSLISPKHVLSAAHCFIKDEGRLDDTELTLAEYDKTTFPRDCKSALGEQECIENILMYPKAVIVNPAYDKDTLENDIAIIELNGYAPYTKYIRPICIPPINIDDPEFANLPLAVAGWGSNGRYLSFIKQSTVVHLVPHDECDVSYPNLSDSHLCAAGLTGQDTCQGDSGGPLMLLYRNNYYVVGVVSGKRDDSPCGTSVPTLYTNVYHYVPWIKSVIN